jgi:hypothetical protein
VVVAVLVGWRGLHGVEGSPRALQRTCAEGDEYRDEQRDAAEIDNRLHKSLARCRPSPVELDGGAVDPNDVGALHWWLT